MQRRSVVQASARCAGSCSGLAVTTVTRRCGSDVAVIDQEFRAEACQLGARSSN